MKILISPYSQKLPEKKRNPKDFPYWEKTVSLIKNKRILNSFYKIL